MTTIATKSRWMWETSISAFVRGALGLAVTSRTNTSNPGFDFCAGLLAKRAIERGLKVPAYVKTSLSPGSRVVTEYLKASGLQPYLDKLGFNLTGYGS